MSTLAPAVSMNSTGDRVSGMGAVQLTEPSCTYPLGRKASTVKLAAGAIGPGGWGLGRRWPDEATAQQEPEPRQRAPPRRAAANGRTPGAAGPWVVLHHFVLLILMATSVRSVGTVRARAAVAITSVSSKRPMIHLIARPIARSCWMNGSGMIPLFWMGTSNVTTPPLRASCST
jgi:hypothetical protein